jgi:hypothetical protein
MIFLSAWAFGLLSLSAVIAFLYFLRRREERVIVSAIWLWSEEQERPRSALVLLWTKIWLLLVQVAALGALVFSLARPTLTQEFLGGARSRSSLTAARACRHPTAIGRATSTPSRSLKSSSSVGAQEL